MKPVVLDASALIEYLLRTAASANVGREIEAKDTDLHIPALCDVEVCSGLRRALLQSKLSKGRAEEAVADYLDLPLTRHGHMQLITRILQLRDNFSAYDATYVALAERLGAIFVTADQSLSKAVKSTVPHLGVIR